MISLTLRLRALNTICRLYLEEIHEIAYLVLEQAPLFVQFLSLFLYLQIDPLKDANTRCCSNLSRNYDLTSH